MSGTSLDGLDIAYCHFKFENNIWHFSIEQTRSVAYDAKFSNTLKECITYGSEKLISFHNKYGSWLGTITKQFITDYNLDVDFISSHGHTVFHQPDLGFTYQIGSGQHLANASGHEVICDFRTNDVSLGGQGAPLVPIGDSLLFYDYDFCLNLGGISNISFDQKNIRVAYDISPANMLLNYICQKINTPYDKGGQLAKKGSLNTSVLNSLNKLPYYALPFPKSLGYEWFVDQVIPIIEKSDDTPENLLHTSVHHISDQISTVIKSTNKENSKILITGGGAKNHFLIETLQKKISNESIIIPSTQIIDFKEALIFAFMGVLRTRNQTNCLHTVTGAAKDSSSGVFYFPS